MKNSIGYEDTSVASENTAGSNLRLAFATILPFHFHVLILAKAYPKEKHLVPSSFAFQQPPGLLLAPFNDD